MNNQLVLINDLVSDVARELCQIDPAEAESVERGIIELADSLHDSGMPATLALACAIAEFCKY